MKADVIKEVIKETIADTIIVVRFSVKKDFTLQVRESLRVLKESYANSGTRYSVFCEFFAHSINPFLIKSLNARSYFEFLRNSFETSSCVLDCFLRSFFRTLYSVVVKWTVFNIITSLSAVIIPQKNNVSQGIFPYCLSRRILHGRDSQALPRSISLFTNVCKVAKFTHYRHLALLLLSALFQPLVVGGKGGRDGEPPITASHLTVAYTIGTGQNKSLVIMTTLLSTLFG